MTPNTFANAVLNAMNAKDPCTIKNYTVLKAAWMLREWYADNAYAKIADLMRTYHGDKRLVAQVAPENYAKYRYFKDRAYDFWWALDNFDAPKADFRTRLRRRRQGIRDAREVISSILEQHFDEKTGTFRFSSIVFG